MERIERRGASIEQLVAGFRQGDAPRPAVHQIDAEGRFEPRQMAADRRGRHPELPRGGRQRAMTGYEAKGAELIQIHRD